MIKNDFKLENRITPEFNYYAYPPEIILAKFRDIFQLSCRCGEDNYVFRFREGQETQAIKAMEALSNQPYSKFEWPDLDLCGRIINEFKPYQSQEELGK